MAALVQNCGVDDQLGRLTQRGYVWIRDRFESSGSALEFARGLIAERRAADGLAALTVVGDFVLPPATGSVSRDFQTLHFDFGLPVNPAIERDVGHFSALHVPMGSGPVVAATRLVPLAPLLGQRSWPCAPELLARLLAYGRTHGAWDDAEGYLEASLARVVEAADGAIELPSVKAAHGFLCGTEFDTLRSEVEFFERHSLQLDAVEIEVPLWAGDLLVFDNFVVAHGRRGVRQPGELHQWVFGERAVAPATQRALRDQVLGAFQVQAAVDPAR